MVFQQKGHRVLEASDGRDALNLIATISNRPDLVISDVMMPEDWRRRIVPHSQSRSSHLPHSGCAHEWCTPARKPRAAGADEIIGKPFDLDALDTLVQRFLPKARRLRAVGSPP